ncbi:MAG TPA: PqiC family protein [Steroidobacteraceae bacterium]
MKALWLCLSSLLLLGACATRSTDHFYILNAEPAAANEPSAVVGTQVWLHVTVPSLVDRGEMVLNTSADGVIVLDHERWAAPLVDQVQATLAQDIERRRPDILVSDRRIGAPSAHRVKLIVNVVQLTARKGDRVSIETHWRLTDTSAGKDLLGSETFTARLDSNDYAAVARGLSTALGLLADKLVAVL